MDLEQEIWKNKLDSDSNSVTLDFKFFVKIYGFSFDSTWEGKSKLTSSTFTFLSVYVSLTNSK